MRSVLNTFIFYPFAYGDGLICVKNTFCLNMGCLERNGGMYCNDLNPSFVVPTTCDLITSFHEYLATLKYGSTLDETHLFYSFYYYLFAFDDIYVDIRFYKER